LWQDAGGRHILYIDNSSVGRVEDFKYIGTAISLSKFYSGIHSGRIEVRECLLSFGAEPFVFQFAVHKHKD